MAESEAMHIIRSVQKKWIINGMLSSYIILVTVSLPILTVLIKFLGPPWWWYIFFALTLLSLIFFINYNLKVSETEVTRFLNQQFPQLEESSGLLLKPYESLNLLEKLQVKKVEEVITGLPEPVSFNKKMKQPVLLLLAGIALSTTLFLFPFQRHFLKGPAGSVGNIISTTPSALLPNVSSVRISITPPVYTGNALRSQSHFNIMAEEGAGINWRLQTTIAADTVKLVVNGSMIVPLRAINNDRTLWTAKKVFKSSGFYQVKIDNKLSELYSVELIKDNPPVIVIQKPKSYTIIDYGQPQQLPMTVSIDDDYGVKEAVIAATTTSGSGEGVKFKEQQLSFTTFRSGNRKNTLQKTLDLPALGMRPGDELYFYVRSVDNHNQESRSDVYMVSIPDTAQLMSLEGLASGVNIKPEYFRSQRQIIIETEQLLKDQKTLTAEAFNNKSNDLGIDQKLLRLRYGKFLGGESDGPAADDHPGDHDHEGENTAADFGNAEKIMDEVSHKHDNAEDASFFDIQTKKQLKATLNEMWSAESKLRTLKPLEALPFEYKALRLLKDLQEKGRSYVAKTTYKTTPLKPEKRLSGDLSKIEEPVTNTNFNRVQNPEDDVRRALGILENLKAGAEIERTALETLKRAGVQLNKKAAGEPSSYLSSVGAMNRVVEALSNAATYPAPDLTAAQKGLQKLVMAQAVLPGADKKHPDQNLSQQYFKNLQRINR